MLAEDMDIAALRKDPRFAKLMQLHFPTADDKKDAAGKKDADAKKASGDKR